MFCFVALAPYEDMEIQFPPNTKFWELSSIAMCGGWGMWVLTFMSLLRHILSTPDEP